MDYLVAKSLNLVPFAYNLEAIFLSDRLVVYLSSIVPWYICVRASWCTLVADLFGSIFGSFVFVVRLSPIDRLWSDRLFFFVSNRLVVYLCPSVWDMFVYDHPVVFVSRLSSAILVSDPCVVYLSPTGL